MAEASYPDGLSYHPEHDWARIDGETATLGITWFAQDALGEVVFFDPPEVGIGMAYLRSDLAEPGTEVEIDVRGKRRPARVASKPLYRKEN